MTDGEDRKAMIDVTHPILALRGVTPFLRLRR
jgi:hypothetical protein